MADNSAGVAAVSTHSRLKAAGHMTACNLEFVQVSTHSRLKAAGKIRGRLAGLRLVSTHSRLKAAVPLYLSICHL